MQFPHPIPHWLQSDTIEIKEAIGKLPNIKPRKAWAMLTDARRKGGGAMGKADLDAVFATCNLTRDWYPRTGASGVAALLRMYEAGHLDLKGKPGDAADLKMFVALQPYREAIAAAQANEHSDRVERWRRATATPDQPNDLTPEDMRHDMLVDLFYERFERYSEATERLRIGQFEIVRTFDRDAAMWREAREPKEAAFRFAVSRLDPSGQPIPGGVPPPRGKLWMDYFREILARENAACDAPTAEDATEVPAAVLIPSAVVPPAAADTYDYIGQLRQVEHAYRDEEARRIGGAVEVTVDEGLIDILADDEVVEVKHGAAWKHALGQVLVYAGSRRFEGRSMRMRLHLFGIDGATLALCRRHCARFGVTVSVAVLAVCAAGDGLLPAGS